MERRTRIGDVDVSFEEHGAGNPTFVLVHGFTGARLDFEDHLEALATTRRVLAADHRGHGGSTNFAAADAYSLDILATDLIAFLEAQGQGAVDLLGHSMGGMVVLRVVLARPDLVRSLVLMDTAAESLQGVALPDGIEAMVRRDGLLALHRKMPILPEAQRMVEQRGEDWLAANQVARLENMDIEAFLALFPEVFGGPSLLDRLGEIACPTTVLVGSQDQPFLAPSEHLAAGIPNARLVQIEGAWHSPQRTHADLWRAKILDHLNS
ncbi:MAG: alpha/beta fold hydrolase [Deltaproteobacteria bacterium]